MKRLVLVLVLVLTMLLSGCSLLEKEETYTIEEVDVLLATEAAKGAANDLDVMALIEDDFYTKVEVDALLESQADVKERTYEIIEVEVIEVNNGVYLIEKIGFLTEQYVLLTTKVFEMGDITNVAVYLNGDIRLWDELKEFD